MENEDGHDFEPIRDHQDDELPEMSEENYHDTLKNHEYVLVNFYKDTSNIEFSGARDVLEHSGFIGKKLGLVKVDANQHSQFVK